MSEPVKVFIKDDLVINPYFLQITELPRREALTMLKENHQDEAMPSDLEKICAYEALDLKFSYIEDPKVAARLIPTTGTIEVDNGGTGGCSFSADTTARRRQRFSVAHELGHYRLKSHCDPGLQSALLAGHIPQAQVYALKCEGQANEFATELLLPYPLLKPLLKTIDFKNDLYKSVEEIADMFDVSMTAALKRIATTLDIPVIAIHFAPDGKCYQLPSYSPEYKDAKFFFEKGRIIPDNSYAALIYDGKTLAARGKKVHPDTKIWFPDRRRDDYKVVEWAMNLGSYGILVFLELIEKDESRY